jgi:hypothetical protein
MTLSDQTIENIPLYKVCQARSGDKGDTCDISVFAPNAEIYDALLRSLTADRVKQHFGDYVRGAVTRYELANLHALKFVCQQALGGGGTASLRSDNLGKSMAANLLRIALPLPRDAAARSPIFHGPEVR